MDCESFHFQPAAATIVSSQRHTNGGLQVAANILTLPTAGPVKEMSGSHLAE
jgi:hypothetical protein